MERPTYTVHTDGHLWMKTENIVTIRLKESAPGFGPEARFRSEDGACAILGALGKHRCFTCGVLEDEYGVVVTEASQQLHPGTYFFIPGRRLGPLGQDIYHACNITITSLALGTLLAYQQTTAIGTSCC